MSNHDVLLHQASQAVLKDLQDCLESLSEQEFITESRQLSDATIGQHTRHVLELYAELHNGYDTGIVNYDNRKRNKAIETDLSFALECLAATSKTIERPDKELTMVAMVVLQQEVPVRSNYHRELLYNLEHAIHHMALIRIAVKELTTVVLSEHFGVASSTIQYRKNVCAQ